MRRGPAAANQNPGRMGGRGSLRRVIEGEGLGASPGAIY